MKTKFLLLVLLLFPFVTILKAQVDVGDSLALVNLYNSTGGANWTNHNNWLTKQPVSNWYGITVKEKRVVSLHLDTNKVQGFIPVSFGNLFMLGSFSAVYNSLQGGLPFTFTKLTNLTYLNLSFNSYLKAQLTPSFSWLRSLTYLNLFSTATTGAIPYEIEKLSNLVYLNLGSNNLIGTIPSSIGRLSKLTYLNLGYDKFTFNGGLTDSIGNLTNLDTLDLSSNYFGGIFPPWIGNLSRLTYLNLGSDNFTGSIPAALGQLKSLADLRLDYNFLTGKFPLFLTQLPKLHNLSVHVNQLSGTIPPQLKNLTQLAGLDLSNNQFSGTIPVELSLLSQLQLLSLNYNQLTGTIPEELGNMLRLTWLSLLFNKLTGHIPATLGNLANLDYLNLSYNKLDGKIPTSMGNIKRIEHLYLGNNRLTGEVPLSVMTLHRLYDVDLSRNELTQQINSYPTDAKIKIDELNIDNNQYTFNGLEYLVSIKKNYQFYQYSQQANIKIHVFQNMMAVSAGGTLGNNTYRWTKVGEISNNIIKGDSTFLPSVSGDYYASITNAIAKDLTLKTDTFHFTVIPESNLFFSLSPNPTHGLLTLYGLNEKSNAKITIADVSGYVWMRAMSRQQSAMKVDVSPLKAGNYFLNVTDGKEVKMVMFVKD